MSNDAERGSPAADIVRKAARAFERDRYLSALLAPPAVHGDLVTLAAFAGELARIPGYVSEPLVGEIRLQWWRDTLDAALRDGTPPAGHPVADALAATARRHRLPGAILHDLIDAIADRLDDRPFADLAALEANLARWDGGLFGLAWRILGGEGAPPQVLSEAGILYGLARCLAESPAELAQGRSMLPADLAAAHGLDLQSAAGLQRLCTGIAAEADRRASEVFQSYQAADRIVRSAALPLALVRPYLLLCGQIDGASLQALDVGPFRRVWRLWRTSRTGRA